ncbi:MAG: histidine phosphatase family protein, partial [Oscillospiraceae bacterium]|nr:histidine phosphatase family protein [Oscillospiraceae bacterium]
MSKIYLIRHGLTEANEQHLYCGSTDLPLSQKGREELAKIKYDIDKSKVCFITSGMKRTEETLKILFGDIPHVIDSRFKEIDFGIFEMKSYNELKDTDEYQQWLDGDNHTNIPPEGESGAQMEKRVLVAFAEIKGTDKDTVIITHGGVIVSIMANYFKEE